MSTPTYPVRVDAALEDRLSRWLWLVKWLLVIPHYIVLVFLWVTFAVLSAVAFIAILFSGRYPHGIFDFNVGVLRWTWRVAYYAYGGLGTDRYPPFTLDEAPGYPAHLEVEYPARLSRGLVLVKWWLLAIPHYVLLAIFMGTGWYVATGGDRTDAVSFGGGLIGLLVLIAAIGLLFTGRYPRSIFDLVLGLNRWVLRVAAYVGLMTDAYPPFRLDLGGSDPGTGVVTRPGPEQPSLVDSTPPPPPGGPPGSARRWSARRVVATVVGSLLAVISLGLVAGGGVVRLADSALRDQNGYLMSSAVRVTSPGHAVTSESLDLHDGIAAVGLPRGWVGTVRVEATGETPEPVFVGIAPTADVDGYLQGVRHSVVLDPAGGPGGVPELDQVRGRAPATAPGDELFWAASGVGEGKQTLLWEAEEGDWTLVVMNASGSAPVWADVAVGVTAPALDEVAVALLVAGLVTGVAAAALLVVALRRRGPGL